jgi:membrane protein YqaA with SNARE-associated domain
LGGIYLKLANKLAKTANKIALSTKALYFLMLISFLQACCLPIAVDLLLLPMMVAKPTKANFYTAMVVLGVVLGGICGYLLGMYCFDLIINPLLAKLGFGVALTKSLTLFDQYGSLILIVSGLIPLPYLLFPITSGVLQLGFIKFILAAVIGRTIRYGAVLVLFKLGLNLKSNYHK